ncbi:uncharacterized protein Hap1MRO34_015890 [Clarias gariepinus]
MRLARGAEPRINCSEQSFGRTGCASGKEKTPKRVSGRTHDSRLTDDPEDTYGEDDDNPMRDDLLVSAASPAVCEEATICLLKHLAQKGFWANNSAAGVPTPAAHTPAPAGLFKHLQVDYITLPPCQGSQRLSTSTPTSSPPPIGPWLRSSENNTSHICLLIAHTIWRLTFSQARFHPVATSTPLSATIRRAPSGPSPHLPPRGSSSWREKALNLQSAYNLVRIREGDKWKTAFITPTGHYEERVRGFALWLKLQVSYSTQVTSDDGMLGRRKRLDIWSHFKYNGTDKKSECVIITDGKHCGQRISGKNTTNLKRHLKANHPHIQLKSNIGSTDSHTGEHPFMFNKQMAAVVLPDSKMETSAQIKAQVERMSKTLQDTFANLQLQRKNHLLYERNLKATQLKNGYREENFQLRLKFFGNDEAEKDAFLYNQMATTRKSDFLRLRMTEAQNIFDLIKKWIHQQEHEFTLLGEAGQELKKKAKWERLNLQLADLQQQCEHIKYLFHLQDKEHKLTCKLVHALLAAYHHQCQTLRAAGMPVDADQEKLLENLLQRVEDDEDDEMTEEVECDTCLLPILEFSHPTLDQSTPCTTSENKPSTSQGILPQPHNQRKQRKMKIKTEKRWK